MGEHLSPLPVPHDQASRPLDKPPRELGYDSGLKFEAEKVPPNRLLPPYHPPGSMHFNDCFEDIGGRKPRQFIEGPGPFNLPSNIVGGLCSDSRFQTLPGHLHGGEIDGLGDLRGGEHTTFGRPYKHVRSGDLFGKDMPSHLLMLSLGSSKLPGHSRFGEPTCFGPFAGRVYMGSCLRLEIFLVLVNHLTQQTWWRHGFGSLASGAGILSWDIRIMDFMPVTWTPLIDQERGSRMGWCRICKVDCETVEGLDIHSQTREHHRYGYGYVRSIKEQNRKKQKTFSDRASAEEKSKTRKAVFEGHGRKT
ncbi:hypothetical protein HAX54_008012 [Datura stramonium]|uniref:Uncharacterized protein n=1 Tax=Datura stramonium TaxID=4076 RepID=A0ABS8WV09_DATST|nr:hypothetical protein [Datura stramonium]